MATAKKAAPKKAAAKKPTKAATATKATGVCAQILDLHKKGKTRAYIIEKGFNKATANTQIARYEKSLRDAKTQKKSAKK